ncbi:zinc transporter ZIP14 [Platysternon megacephalum]|uniref:Zinc transporter ZIP14 n=1 Tax=Platysternon megacephalum TaxID=55544 RepID=A0A4D9EN93_9SAUR|nr:zinc transporter ZIP14 [Platysternon megacephalum]
MPTETDGLFVCACQYIWAVLEQVEERILQRKETLVTFYSKADPTQAFLLISNGSSMNQSKWGNRRFFGHFGGMQLERYKE